MQLGNQNPNPTHLYNESEQLFLAVLEVNPEMDLAAQNLESVRRNRKLRGLPPLKYQNYDKPPRKPTKFLEMPRSTETSTCTSIPSSNRLLTIGIPTVPREGNPNYLSQTLNAIINQLPIRSDDPLYRSIIVLVLNNQPGEHQEFEDVRKMIENSIYSHFFLFKETNLSEVRASVSSSGNQHTANWIHNPKKVCKTLLYLRKHHGKWALINCCSLQKSCL